MKKVLLSLLFLTNISALTATGRTSADYLLILAAKKGDIEKVKKLVEEKKVSSEAKNKALVAADTANTANPTDACMTNHTLIIEYLFDHGAIYKG